MKKLYSLALLLFCYMSLKSQYEMKPVEGYSHDIGLMMCMLADLKDRITDQVKDLDQNQTDFLFDKDANSMGSLVMHLVATEAYYQIETLVR